MSLSSVTLKSLTTTPPFEPINKPAFFANEISGRTPIAKMTSSAGISLPSAKTTEFSVIELALVASSSSTPLLRSSSASKDAISGSNGASTCGAASMIVVLIPRCTKFSAISRPINPPPITTALFGAFSTRFTIASTSSIVRNVKACSTPSIGGIIGVAPVLSTSLSYASA